MQTLAIGALASLVGLLPTATALPNTEGQERSPSSFAFTSMVGLACVGAASNGE